MNRKTNVIAHHGIKGMKWGVRRTPEQLGHKIRSSFRPKSKSENKAPVQTKPSSGSNPQKTRTSVKDLSDDELRKVINRIELERKYSTLTAPQVSKGRKFVTDVLYNSAKATATTYTTKAMTKAVEKLLEGNKKK